ncbi:MAG: RNA polymerase factor sigma-54 [Treponema sp.]|jgi:RNA polymerase sigma-54 factor|nr:RNA polymerase factor sigma-54 [Treponema sp.]
MQLQRPSFIQEQRLRMNPQFHQSLKLMELPVMDLRESIEEELERNPALEVLEDHSTVSLDEAVGAPPREEDAYFEASSDSGFVRRGGEEASDEQRRFIEGVLTRPETLQQHLLWQLQLESRDDELRAIAEILIQNLDEDGFHKEPPETLYKKGPDFPVAPPPRLAEAMRLIRSLDPAGACTADYRESLRVQIGLMPDAPAGIEQALDHLELLERGKFAEAAKKMNRSEEEARLFFERIKELSPFPGRQFAAAEVRYVVPDIQVVRDEGEFVIILNEEEIPVLGINPFFMELARTRKGEERGAAGSGPARDFVRENIREARWFIGSINRRNHTLLRVTRAIVEFQRSFFVNGPKYLAPLTLADIAGELGVHETTISRIANGKYMQTEWGIFEIRSFFSNAISGTGSAGSLYSKGGVKAVIQEIIAAENRRLSDKDIADLLARRGISLARRTVAKYRKELDMGSSYTR